jgi:hypothetical protein
MNRKTFLALLVALIVLGGAGFALFWQDLGAWRNANARLGSKPFEKLPVGTIARIHLKDGGSETTLSLKGEHWVVGERGDYGANARDIGDLLVKLPDVKVVQTESVGASLLPRLNLVEPGKAAKGEEAGTLLELSDKSGKVVASVLLGKKVIKTEDSPLPIKPQTPVGRYVLSPGAKSVLVLSDALVSAEANPARWLAKDFFKVDRAKSLAYSGSGAPWKIARSEEYGQWKFAAGSGMLDPSAAVSAVNALSSLAFTDVAPEIKPESLENPRTLVADTFENLTYTIKAAKKPGTDEYYLAFTVAGEPPRERKPEKDEKSEDKARRDKQFSEDLQKLEARLKLEKELANWTYVVAGKTLEPLLKDRPQFVIAPRKK